jgi:cysteinyl-tRNA synthetase
MTDLPDDVRRLAAEREERRASRDFAAADELRNRIAGLGYRVVDAPGGPTLERVEAPAVARVRPGDVPSVLDRDPRFDATVQWIVEGWPEDVRRGVEAFGRHAGDRSIQHVVADVTGRAAGTLAGDGDVELVSLVDGTGWAAARNAALRRTLGRIALVLDGSVEPAGDVVAPLVEALADPTIGVAGPFGIVTRDLNVFEPSDGPEVDAIEGYLMAFRREVLAAVGGFDERFRWYRSADIELSFRIKDLGLRAVVVDVPLERHEHRTWGAATEDERARWSKRNFNRFLDRFRGRFDLTVGGGGAAADPRPDPPPDA